MNDPNFCVSNLENRATLKIATSLKIISESKETENKIEKERKKISTSVSISVRHLMKLKNL